MVFPLFGDIPGVSVCVQISSPYKDTSHIGLGLTLMTSFYLNHLFKALSPKQLLSRELGVRTSTCESGAVAGGIQKFVQEFVTIFNLPHWV